MDKSESEDEDHIEKEEVLDVMTPNYKTVVIMKMFAECSGMSKFCSKLQLFVNRRNFEVEFDPNIN